jgi:copper transport protein
VRTLRPAGIATGFALAALLALAGPLLAHSLPQSSTPSPGATLQSPPTVVTITFGETPDPKLSSIRVLDTSGASVTAGPTTAVAGDALTLSVPLSALGPGVYTVSWRTVSAVDGHAASGSFAFGVGVAPATSPGATIGGAAGGGAASPSAGAILGRWLLFLGLLCLLGGAFFGAVLAPAPVSVTRRLLPVAWLTAAVGTCLVLGVQLSDAGEGVAEAMGTSLGPAILARIATLALGGLAVAYLFRAGPVRPGLALVALASAGALATDVLFSHAAAGPNAPLDVLEQAIHVLAVGLWLGGLVALVVTLRRATGEAAGRAARRYSRMATIGIAAVAVTGLLRAVPEVGTFDALVSSDFGRLVIAKTGLLSVLALLGAVNHFRHVPAARESVSGLRRVGSLELLLGATILLLSASLVNLAPPAQVAAS